MENDSEPIGENIGYVRVSTSGQERDGYSLEAQRAQLRQAGCQRVCMETASGGHADRKELTRMLDRLHCGDVVVVKLDRLARSLRDLLNLIERVNKIGAMAEFERSLIGERTKVGLDADKRAGRKLGRHFKLSDADRRQIVHPVREGKLTAADCARTYHLHESNISRLLAKADAEIGRRA